MIGYKSLVHQGWKDQRIGHARNPYPRYSEAYNQYESGVNRAIRGEPWETPRVSRKQKRTPA